MKSGSRYILFFCLAAVLYGCYRHNEQTLFPASLTPGSTGCDTSNVSYDRTVSPIFIQNCALAGCHASSSSPSGYTLDSYDGAKTLVQTGRLIGAINHASGYAQMPKDRPM